MPGKALATFVLLLTICCTALAAGAKVEQIGAFSDSTASEAIKKVLDSKGYRVTLTDGVLCDIWLRAGIVANAKNDAQGAAYTNLADSAFIGVISFSKPAMDFRKQGIKPGTYTLRYSLHPLDGNHMGISPIRDFLLMLPLALDKDPDAKYKFEDLVAISKKAAGVNHPAPISLVSPEGINTWPSVFEDEYGHVVFAAKLKTAANGELPIAFVVKGVVEAGG